MLTAPWEPDDMTPSTLVPAPEDQHRCRAPAPCWCFGCMEFDAAMALDYDEIYDAEHEDEDCP